MGKASKDKELADTEAILSRLNFIRKKRQEYLICFSMDWGGRIIKRRTVTVGLLDMSIAHPREIFAGPVRDRAAYVVIAHNHPSGDASPSKKDIKTTQQLIAAGLILGIPLHDHIIVTRNEEFSFMGHLLV